MMKLEGHKRLTPVEFILLSPAVPQRVYEAIDVTYRQSPPTAAIHHERAIIDEDKDLLWWYSEF